MKRKWMHASSLMLGACLLFACGASPAPAAGGSPGGAPGSAVSAPAPARILLAAAASLEPSFQQELIPLFQTQHPWVTVEGAYDSSGKLQTQIEEGLEADVFMSAAPGQMDALAEAGFVDAGEIVDLLENEIVLITAKNSGTSVVSFETIAQAAAIAMGDPASVPAGQYAEEVLSHLGLWQAVQAKASWGTNVTEVLNWVAEGSAEVGIVYATDAAALDGVTVLDTAPQGSLRQPVAYPLAPLSGSRNPQAARLFVEFLQTPEAAAVWRAYGFRPAA